MLIVVYDGSIDCSKGTLCSSYPRFDTFANERFYIVFMTQLRLKPQKLKTEKIRQLNIPNREVIKTSNSPHLACRNIS